MERYEAYKDSGVEWIGEIPADWSAMRLGRCLSLNQGGVWGDDPDGDNGTIVLRSTEQTVDGKWCIDNPAIRNLEAEANYTDKLLAVGDLIVTKSSGSELHIGKTTIVDAEIAALRCSYSNFMQRLRTNSLLLPAFCWYLLNSDLARSQYCYMQNSTSGLGNLNSDTIADVYIPVPPIALQEQIANHLDAKTAEIDALAADCEREVELLWEYRKAVISEAVTKGLDPEAPMRDSGVEWIGEIPEGWEIQAVRRIASIVRGASPRPAGDPEYFNGDYMPWITVAEVTNCTGKYITKTSSYLTEKGSLQSRVIEQGTLLLSNSGATLGVPRISLIRGCINDGSVAFLNISVDIAFLYYVLASMTDRLREMVKYGGQPNLNTDIVKSINIVTPPLSEQKTIAEYLDAKTAEIDSLIEAKQTMADKLREYRRSLISEAVTGKFKVPGV